MSKRLYAAVQDYLSKDIYPFHMPGHKRNTEYFDMNLLDFDLTEIDGTDNLHYPETVILETEKRLAEIFGANETHILINGSTAGIVASILANSFEGDKVLLARNSHQSAYSGLVLSGASPVYVYPETTAYGITGGVCPDNIQKALAETDGIKCVLITSPTYEGFVSDITAIAEIVHAKGIPLILDEAHGAHFTFSESFPKPALTQGADIVIHSLHKTLPALSQSSLIHINSRTDTERLKAALRLIQTSSPSYILMSMIDKIMNELYKNGAMSGFVNEITACRAVLKKNLKNITLIDKIEGGGVAEVDISKLCFYINNGGLTGKDALSFLAENARVQLEMNGLKHFLAITGVADMKYGLDRLVDGVLSLDKLITDKSYKSNDRVSPETLPVVFSEIESSTPVFTPREAFFRKKTLCALELSAGQVSGGFITPYPPGIPLLVPGELITEKHISTLNAYLGCGIQVNGITDGKVMIDYNYAYIAAQL